MTVSLPGLIVAFLVGVGIGVVYFGGLWWTVQKLPSSKSPALLALGSFLGRTAVTLLGFYFAMGGRWERVLACFIGFILSRQLLVRRGRVRKDPYPKKGEVQKWMS
jgi:F1F0 ATPase subunit 2